MGSKIIQTNQQALEFNKKRKQLLGISLGSVTIAIMIGVALLIGQVETNILTLVTLFLLVGLLVIIFILKPKLMYYSMHYRYQLLLANSIKPYEVNEKFDALWINKLLNFKYQYAAKFDHFDILYRITKPIERSAFHSNHILEIVTIIKDNSLDFYSDVLNDEYKKLWIEHQNKYRISKQIIIQFKKYQQFDDDIKNDLDRIIAFKEGSNYLISVNCGYFTKDHTTYYLHSNDYYPNLYYKYAVDSIKSFIQ